MLGARMTDHQRDWLDLIEARDWSAGDPVPFLIREVRRLRTDSVVMANTLVSQGIEINRLRWFEENFRFTVDDETMNVCIFCRADLWGDRAHSPDCEYIAHQRPVFTSYTDAVLLSAACPNPMPEPKIDGPVFTSVTIHAKDGTVTKKTL